MLSAILLTMACPSGHHDPPHKAPPLSNFGAGASNSHGPDMGRLQLPGALLVGEPAASGLSFMPIRSRN